MSTTTFYDSVPHSTYRAEPYPTLNHDATFGFGENLPGAGFPTKQAENLPRFPNDPKMMGAMNNSYVNGEQEDGRKGIANIYVPSDSKQQSVPRPLQDSHRGNVQTVAPDIANTQSEGGDSYPIAKVLVPYNVQPPFSENQLDRIRPLNPNHEKENIRVSEPAPGNPPVTHILEQFKNPFDDINVLTTSPRSPIPLAYSSPPSEIPDPIIPKDAKSYLDIIIPCPQGKDHPPIYDTCTQVRAKISHLLKNKSPSPKDGVPNQFTKDGKPKPWTIAEFQRASANEATGNYYRFMKAKGRMGGCHNSTYINAYLFFEKKRIWEKAPKSAARKKCEAEHPGGLFLWDPNKDFLTMTAEEARTGRIKGFNC